jgi:hypothetical protein
MDINSFKGIVRIREYPQEWDLKTFRYWWCDERRRDGSFVHKARMTPAEKERYTVYEAENLLTNAGFTNLLTNVSVQTTGTMIVFFKVLDVNSGPISAVYRSDTTMAGGGTSTRKAPTGFTIIGTQTDVAIPFTGSEALYTWTNIGIWGNAATTTPGTGTLYTHALYSYPHGGTALTADYLLTFTN